MKFKINSIANQALLSFEVDYMGMRHETNYYFMPKAIFSLNGTETIGNIFEAISKSDLQITYLRFPA